MAEVADPLGALLRAFRLRSLQSQEALAERAGVSVRTIRTIERGAGAVPHSASVDRLVTALDLTPDERAGVGSALRALADGRRATAADAPGPVRPAELPAAVGDFVGRDGLLRGLTAPLPDAPSDVIAIAGRPGIGKTALAVQVAHRLRATFPGGQLYVDLQGVADRPPSATAVAARFLRALGVDGRAVPADADERFALYRSLLVARPVLVVLDNAADAAQVRPLLPGTASSRVLITSRRRLSGLTGVRHVDLEGLDPAAAVDLLRQAAGRAPVDAEPAAAADIVRWCGYLPLAIRIAAARLAGPPPGQLRWLAGLLADERRRLDALSAGDLAVGASFALSYRQLAPADALVLRTVAALPGPDFAAWAAAVALDIPAADAERALDRLVEARLLDLRPTDRLGTIRYGFHDLVRLFARQEADRVDGPAWLRATAGRVLDCWLALAVHAVDQLPSAAEYRPPAAATAVALPAVPARLAAADPIGWLEGERAALAAAVQLAAELGLSTVGWQLAASLPVYFSLTIRFEEWERIHRTALAGCTAAGDVRGEGWLLAGLAQLEAGERGRVAVVRPLVDRAVAALREVGDTAGEAYALQQRAYALMRTGDGAAAVQVATSALALARTAGDDVLEAQLLFILGSAELEGGRVAQASDALDAATAQWRRIGKPRDIASSEWKLGAAHRAAGRPHEAIVRWRLALGEVRALGDRRGEARLSLDLGDLLLEQGADDEGIALLDRAAALSRAAGLRDFEARAAGARGRHLLRRKDSRGAVAALVAALARWEELGDVREQRGVRSLLAVAAWVA